jgi:hypothetical protein
MCLDLLILWMNTSNQLRVIFVSPFAVENLLQSRDAQVRMHRGTVWSLIEELLKSMDLLMFVGLTGIFRS